MSKPKLKRPAPGTVLGALALIVAVAGNANAFGDARTIVRKGDIAPGAVTARTIAKGAVRTKKLAKGAVTGSKLAAGAVGAAALGNDAVTTRSIKVGAVAAASLAPDAVTAPALAPGSVYGGALGPITVHSVPIKDLDAVPANPEWTASDTGIAMCAPGERLLTGGGAFTNPGNREVTWTELLPFSNSSANGMAARIATNSGGLAAAEVQAICLK